MPLYVAVFLASITNCGSTDVTRSYDVAVPEEWKSYISAGKLTVIGSPFYGVRKPGRRSGLTPVVRINWSLKNLTSGPLNVEVNYWSKMTTDTWKSGYGVSYALGPKEERIIDDIMPVVSAQTPVKCFIRMERLRRSQGVPDLVARETVVATDPLPVSHVPHNGTGMTKEKNKHFTVKDVRLAHSKEDGNVLLVHARNNTGKELPLGLSVGVADPKQRDRIPRGTHAWRGTTLSAESMTKVAARSDARISLPYSVPPVGPDPLLAFALYEVPRDVLTTQDVLRKQDIRPFYWGWYNLRQAVERKACVLPIYVPVKERANLTEEKRSKHFLFRYRPGSYAEQQLPTIIREREEAYELLSTALDMEIRRGSIVDLYPDMEAKGLGSGTTYTPANCGVTKSGDWIMEEVYNETMKIPPGHELAHIFAFTFGRAADGLMESFAVYFESGTDVARARETVQGKLREGTLPPLGEILLLEGICDELVTVVDFLLKKDVEKFKRFYAATASGDLEKVSKEVYGENLKALEEEWHLFLKGPR